MSVAEVRTNGMMAHLMDALSQGEDIGHYGRLVFVMVARHFLSEDQLFKQLQLDPNLDEEILHCQPITLLKNVSHTF